MCAARVMLQETAELRLKLDNSQGDVRGQLKEKDDKINEILNELGTINALYNEAKENKEQVGLQRASCRLERASCSQLEQVARLFVGLWPKLYRYPVGTA